jgi:phage tail protein X
MTLRRYARTPTFGLGFRYGTSLAIKAIRDNIDKGNIRFDEVTVQEYERLDILAARFYGEGTLGWVIAAASGIGWMPQVPPGTLVRIPNIDDVSKFTG